jgi:16S rRNA (uracil1498-N3)-methyltransferase
MTSDLPTRASCRDCAPPSADRPSAVHDSDRPESSPPEEPTSPGSLGGTAQVFVADVDELAVTTHDEHHLVHVLRLRPGETVVAADGQGRWRLCRFTAAASGGALRSPILEADGPVFSSSRLEPAVTVAFVPVKGGRPEWIVQKLTEAGVDRIVVLHSLRSVVRWEGERRSKALDRLRRVAREAAAQSRQPWLPDVVGVADLDDLSTLLVPVPLALAQRGGDAPSLRAPAVAVGPEGGWDSSETAPERPLMGLGSHVLRAETAAVAAGLLLCALREGLVRPSPTPGDLSRSGTDT